jgi:sugar phosphate isomerase/epimerase
MMLKRQKPGALQLARDCALDGIEVDIGPLGNRPTFENNLLKDDFREAYLSKARELNLAISSLAMSAFYGQSYYKHPKVEEFAQQWIELMGPMGTKVGFLPIVMGKEDDARSKLVEMIKRIAPKAESAKVVLGLNTPFDSGENNKLLDDIGSPAVRIAYNCGEVIDAGRDVYKELRDLGRDRIAQVIPTLSDGVLLKDDTRMEVPKLKLTLDDLDWSGWLVLQRSRPKDAGNKVRENFSANAAYLRSIFQS